MKVYKETVRGDTNPLFLRFINRTLTVGDLLRTFFESSDLETVRASQELINSPPDLEYFRVELEDAVRDLARAGLNEEITSFLDHYMEPSLLQEFSSSKNSLGENRSSVAKIKDKNSTWIEGFICFNLTLYIKAFGLDNLKICKTCGKLFAHKGKWAVYCEDGCNPKKRR